MSTTQDGWFVAATEETYYARGYGNRSPPPRDPKDWQPVTPGGIERLRVEGGWLYRAIYYQDPSMDKRFKMASPHMTFVPDPPPRLVTSEVEMKISPISPSLLAGFEKRLLTPLEEEMRHFRRLAAERDQRERRSRK